MEPLYNVVFHGKLFPEKTIKEVKENLSILFKVSVDKLDPWFLGQSVTIKKNVNAVIANKYKRVFEKAGAYCIIEPSEHDKLLDQQESTKKQNVANRKGYKIILKGETDSIPDKNLATQTAIRIRELLEQVYTNFIVTINVVEEGSQVTTTSEKSASSLMICPQCGFEQPQAEMCGSCGIIIQKYFERKKSEFLERKKKQKTKIEPSQAIEKSIPENPNSPALSVAPSQLSPIVLSSEDLYSYGMNTILASAIMFSSPFLETTKILTTAINQLIEKPEKFFELDYSKCDLRIFLSNFYTYSLAFIETISLYFAETIRRNSIRGEMRAQTTDALADMIQKESFRKINTILAAYVSIMAQLGIELQNTSTIRSTIEGGAIGSVLAGGNSDTLGTIAGAIIGAAVAHYEKQRLKQELISTAVNGVHDFIDSLPSLMNKLMDQYASYMYGEKIDFVKRDQQITRATPIIQEIITHCKNILHYHVIFYEAIFMCEQYAIKKVGFRQIFSLSNLDYS